MAIYQSEENPTPKIEGPVSAMGVTYQERGESYGMVEINAYDPLPNWVEIGYSPWSYAGGLLGYDFRTGLVDDKVGFTV